METSLKTGFTQIFSCCPKNLSRPKFGGAAAPLAPPARTPMPLILTHRQIYMWLVIKGIFDEDLFKYNTVCFRLKVTAETR